jgi:hypothetical protein
MTYFAPTVLNTWIISSSPKAGDESAGIHPTRKIPKSATGYQMLFGVHIEITSPASKPRFRRTVEKYIEYCFTSWNVSDLFVRALMKLRGDEGELIGLKYWEGINRKSQRGI